MKYNWLVFIIWIATFGAFGAYMESYKAALFMAWLLMWIFFTVAHFMGKT